MKKQQFFKVPQWSRALRGKVAQFYKQRNGLRTKPTVLLSLIFIFDTENGHLFKCKWMCCGDVYQCFFDPPQNISPDVLFRKWYNAHWEKL